MTGPTATAGLRSGPVHSHESEFKPGVALLGGNPDAAAERFIDYWSGTGTWARTPEQRRPPLVASVRNVRRWGHALFTEPTALSAFRSLDVPVLCMVGKRSTPSAHAVARLLASALPRVEIVEFENLGHMGPVTHPDVVIEAIARFLERTHAADGLRPVYSAAS